MRAMEGVGFILGRGIALPQLGMGAVPQKHCENLATNINKILHIFYQIHLLNLLPATAAIEYVAACCRTRTRTRTKTGTKTKIGTITKIVRGPYVRSPQVQYVYAPSGLSVPSNVA